MSDLPISSPYRSRPEAPVGDRERDELTARLNSAFTNGNLDSDDYQVRLDRLFAASKMGELVPVVDGLPPMQTYDNPANITSGGTPGEVGEARGGHRLTLAVLLALVAVVVLIAILLLFVG